MVELIINNSVCQIKGLDNIQMNKLKNTLSYTIESKGNYYNKAFRYQKRYLIDRYGNFPTGLLYLVERFLTVNCLQFLTNDIRRFPQPRHGLFSVSLPHEPYTDQIEAAKACKSFTRGIITAPTGLGKSTIACLIINELQVPTLVVVPSLELKRQLTDTFRNTFGKDKVGDLSSCRPIAVENVDAINPDKVISDYDSVIIDEFHHSGAMTYRKLNKTAFSKIYYKFGLTATPFRSNENERLLLESVLSQVIYRIEYGDAVNNGFIVPMEAYYIDLPKIKITGDQFKWASMYSELVVNNYNRNMLIAQILASFHQSKLSSICLVKEIQQGENIRVLIQDREIPFIRGESGDNKENLESFNDGTTPVIIGTTGVLGEGCDTKPAEFIIIAGLGKSPNQIIQNIGRGFRRYPGKTSCKIIIFKDSSHRWTLNHFREQCRILKQHFNVIPIKLEIKNELG